MVCPGENALEGATNQESHRCWGHGVHQEKMLERLLLGCWCCKKIGNSGGGAGNGKSGVTVSGLLGWAQRHS